MYTVSDFWHICVVVKLLILYVRNNECAKAYKSENYNISNLKKFIEVVENKYSTTRFTNLCDLKILKILNDIIFSQRPRFGNFYGRLPIKYELGTSLLVEYCYCYQQINFILLFKDILLHVHKAFYS